MPSSVALTVLFPDLLWRSLSAELREGQTLESTILGRIHHLHIVFLERQPQVFQSDGFARIVGRKGRSTETLAQDFVSRADARWIVGGGEELALDLGKTKNVDGLGPGFTAIKGR